MKKIVLCMALAGFVAAPVMGDLIENTVPKAVPESDMNTIGVYLYGSIIPMDLKVAQAPSDNVVVTFGWHWPGPTDNLHQIQFDFLYDNSEVEVVGTAPMGAFVGQAGNMDWGDTVFPNPSSGMQSVSLWGNPASGTGFLATSGVYPFLQVELHMKNGLHEDSANDVMIGTTLKLLASHIATDSYPPYTSYWWSYNYAPEENYGIDYFPEPSSMALLAVGLLTMGGGLRRRLRR